jgi:hypothetical protein
LDTNDFGSPLKRRKGILNNGCFVGCVAIVNVDSDPVVIVFEKVIPFDEIGTVETSVSCGGGGCIEIVTGIVVVVVIVVIVVLGNVVVVVVMIVVVFEFQISLKQSFPRCLNNVMIIKLLFLLLLILRMLLLLLSM